MEVKAHELGQSVRVTNIEVRGPDLPPGKLTGIQGMTASATYKSRTANL
jgi:hypothetical protein